MAKKKSRDPSRGATDPRPREKPVKKAAAKSDGSAAASPEQAERPANERFPIVGIGASAGGLEAFRRFLTAMPEDSGVAVILVPHLDPTHESMMVSLLARQTKIPVCEAEDGTAVQPNRVYVIPPNKCLSIQDGVLHLSSPPVARRLEMAIDIFLRSLAKDQQQHAIGIVLSGTGTSGTSGLKEIKLLGGMVMAQEPESTEYDQMPRSAIDTGLMDYVLPPEDMPAAIIRYVRELWMKAALDRIDAPNEVPNELSEILALLHSQTRQDFRCYRRNMILRRIQRRMGLRQIGQLSDYLQCLSQQPDEVTALCQDLLISVTGFFRDPEAFRDLEQTVIPALIRRPPSPDTRLRSGTIGKVATLLSDMPNPVRVWVPGCATGEEAYSIAILLFEGFAAVKRTPDFQLFATDLNPHSPETGRHGIYPDSAMADMSPERLSQFFVRVDEHHFRVSKALRESVVFACHNLISDAPFSRLDLIACRNLLIYLEPEVQRKMIALFHFALQHHGYLMLGASEATGRAVDLFEPVSRSSRIFRRIGPRRHDLIELPMIVGGRHGAPEAVSRLPPRHSGSFVELLNRALIRNFAPAAVLITRKYEILSQHGPLVNYLEFPPGEPTRDLLAMARQGLANRIRAAVHHTIRTGKPTSDDDSHVKRDDIYGRCRVTVTPVSDVKAGDGLLLVSFEDLSLESGSQPSGGGRLTAGEESPLVEQLQHELKATADDLQSMIAELENSNEELRIANEEAMSMNEELQSANEELESSKEELQSLNEELTTVNNQLQEKVQELDKANCDISNLMVSAEIATLFLDDQLCIQLFTAPAGELLNLRTSDIGRPFRNIAPAVDDSSLLADCREVLQRGVAVEKEVRSSELQDPGRPESTHGPTDSTGSSRCYLRRILPYRSSDRLAHGVVITLLDITAKSTTNICGVIWRRARHALSGLAVRSSV